MALEAVFGFGELLEETVLDDAAAVEDGASVGRRDLSPAHGADGLGDDELDRGGILHKGHFDGALDAALHPAAMLVAVVVAADGPAAAVESAGQGVLALAVCRSESAAVGVVIWNILRRNHVLNF